MSRPAFTWTCYPVDCDEDGGTWGIGVRHGDDFVTTTTYVDAPEQEALVSALRTGFPMADIDLALLASLEELGVPQADALECVAASRFGERLDLRHDPLFYAAKPSQSALPMLPAIAELLVIGGSIACIVLQDSPAGRLVVSLGEFLISAGDFHGIKVLAFTPLVVRPQFVANLQADVTH